MWSWCDVTVTVVQWDTYTLYNNQLRSSHGVVTSQVHSFNHSSSSFTDSVWSQNHPQIHKHTQTNTRLFITKSLSHTPCPFYLVSLSTSVLESLSHGQHRLSGVVLTSLRSALLYIRDLESKSSSVSDQSISRRRNPNCSIVEDKDRSSRKILIWYHWLQLMLLTK